MARSPRFATLGLAAGIACFPLLGGCAPAQPALPTPAAPLATAAPVARGGDVQAEGRVVPARRAQLSLPAGGVVAAVLVPEGATVTAGQPLLRLDRGRAEAALAQAQADLRAARAAFERLRSGARPEEIAVAEAQAAQARAQLRQVQGGVTRSDVAAAQAQLDQARAALARLAGGASAADLAQAQAAVDQATAGGQTARERLAAAKVQAEAQVQQAANALRDAQDAYSRVYWQNRNLERAAGDLPQERRDQEAAAQRAVQNAEAVLGQARTALTEAQQAEVSGGAAADAQVREAQAALDRLRAGSTADAIAAARAQVAAAQANLDRLQGEQRGGALEAAQAGVRVAEANLAQLRSGAAAGDLAVAQAEVQRAEAAVQLAQVALAETELKAPFAGTVAALAVNPGEFVAAGAPLVTLADLGTLEVETTDLGEVDAARVREGSPVTLTFDALPDVELRGTVSRVRPLGESQQGDMTYTATVALDRQDPRLRWNMTAAVAISTEPDGQ
jgi:HlyD family secretion protein